MPLPSHTAVILVDHGSTRDESNRLLFDVAAAYREHVSGIVEPAHMELAEPTIGAAFARCVAEGAKKIVVVPYFLGPGKHWTEDIPRLTAGAAAHHPDVEYAIAAPLGLHPLMLEIIDARMSDALYPAG
jgi:sirohydrochlorin ferrochelatase